MKLAKAKFHFVGIGGIGMCGLAEILFNMGAAVTGSDISENANTLRLKSIGIAIHKGHRAENVGDASVVVYSSAVKMNNPEIAEARARQIPLIPRAEALAEIMLLQRGIAVAGTHGKTTTTSMTASVFLEAKVDPTIFVGGRLALIDSTAKLGQGEWLIAESDESDGSFAKLSPEIAIITNIDSDHLDHHKTFENLQKAFYDFALKVPFYGLCIVCGDDHIVEQTFEHYPKRLLSYGFKKTNDFVLEGEKGHYQISKQDKNNNHMQLLGEFEISLPGRHNALNATAAIIAGLTAGFDFEVCSQGIKKFAGVDRRFDFKGEKNNILVYDDYGHHPTEVKAVLQAFKEKFPEKKLVVAFQPHRYSRTQSCWHDFTQSFAQADEVLLLDIYPAGEAPIDGINSEILAKELQHKHCVYIPKSQQNASEIQKYLKSGDIFLTLGAGDGWKLGTEFLKS